MQLHLVVSDPYSFDDAASAMPTADKTAQSAEPSPPSYPPSTPTSALLTPDPPLPLPPPHTAPGTDPLSRTCLQRRMGVRPRQASIARRARPAGGHHCVLGAEKVVSRHSAGRGCGAAPGRGRLGEFASGWGLLVAERVGAGGREVSGEGGRIGMIRAEDMDVRGVARRREHGHAGE